MAIRSGFFNSVNGDRRYLASDFAEYFATFIGNGVFPNPSTGLQVVEATNMTVNVKAGKGWINGYYFVNDSDYSLALDVADGTLKRIDRIVLRLNFSSREIVLAIKKGTFASSPIAPTLQRDADAHELALADVYINNGATAISQANITDQRLNTSLCGIVKGTVDQIDTTGLFAQYQTAFENFITTEQTEFNEWFATIQGTLDGDVAGNLANQITNFKHDYNYQTPVISGTQIRLTNPSNVSRLVFKLDTTLNGNITISTDGGTTSKNLVDVDGVQVTSLDKGFVEVVAESNFFILRNSGMSKSDLQQLIAIANEMEANESVVKTNYINAVNSADSSITLPSDASWNDVLLQIPNVRSGRKRWTTGRTSIANDKLTVSGLDFTPSFVIYSGKYNNSGINDAAGIGVVTDKMIHSVFNSRKIFGAFAGAATGSNIFNGHTHGVSSDSEISDWLYYGGFNIPISSAKGMYEWYAFE